MSSKSNAESYEKAMQLAEAGKLAEALEQINLHLAENPKDAEAWNDKGSVVYCMGQVEHALEYFERARSLCPESIEILWNLSEAYIDAGHPGAAARLFADMNRLEILNADVVNRVANLFVDQNLLGSAVEMLMYSLELSPEQQILHPMLDVIRSKRARIALFSSDNSDQFAGTCDFIKQRYAAEAHILDGQSHIGEAMKWCDIALFDGCNETVVQISRAPKTFKMIVRINEDDLAGTTLDAVNWQDVDFIIVKHISSMHQAVRERLGDADLTPKLLSLSESVDTSQLKFVNRERGKKIACLDSIGPSTNPMMLLQCMQKLNYIDSDYRLYFAGGFEDRPTERYVQHVCEMLDINDAVIFDNCNSDMNSWLRDKHYIASAAIDSSGLNSVLTGMACGLKPIVHNSPAAAEVIEADFLFNISEQFCEQVVGGNYQPQLYRTVIEQRHDRITGLKVLNEMLARVERLMDLKCNQKGFKQICDDDANISVADNEQWQITSAGKNFSQTVQSGPETAGISSPEEAFAITPIAPQKINVRYAASLGENDSQRTVETCDWGDPASKQQVTQAEPKKKLQINQIAAEALNVSRQLEKLAHSGQQMPEADWDQADTDQMELAPAGQSPIDASAKGQSVSELASEFSTEEFRAKNQARRTKNNESSMVS